MDKDDTAVEAREQVPIHPKIRMDGRMPSAKPLSVGVVLRDFGAIAHPAEPAGSNVNLGGDVRGTRAPYVSTRLP
jgi:hypothetical protein